MAYRPLLTLTPSARTATEGTRSDIAELRPIAGRSTFQQQPLVIPTLKFQPIMEESLTTRVRGATRGSVHSLLTATGQRVGVLTPNEHITGRTSSPSRIINVVARKIPKNPLPNLRRIFNR